MIEASQPTLAHRILEERPSRVLIISSGAGGGNFSAGRALAVRLTDHAAVRHVQVEDLIGERLRVVNFDHHRWICNNAPYLLHLSYRLPFIYWWKKKSVRSLPDDELALMVRVVKEFAPDIVVAMNHRAALWLGWLKQRRRISGKIWAVATDYAHGPGWRFNFWDDVSRFLSPTTDAFTARLGEKHTVAALPVDPSYEALRDTLGDRGHVLVSGGAWALGPLERVVEALRLVPDTQVHLACGANTELFKTMSSKHRGSSRVTVHPMETTLSGIMTVCGSVITRPGAMTMSEAHAARRKIFLLPGLPAIEAANRRYAIVHFDASDFSVDAFQRWRFSGGLS